MENLLLQPSLHAGLIEIGDSDERLSNIEKSIADLETKLKEDTSLLPGYTLVALDPNIGDTEPILIDVESIVTPYWKALRAKFTERPIPILRAVILNALYNVGHSDATIARIIYLTAVNFYPYAKLGREKEIVEKLISELGDMAEENATEEWSLVDEERSLKLGVLKVAALKFGEISINPKKLNVKLKEASGRTPNNYDPYNHPDQWSTHFSTTASEGIMDVLKSSIDQFGSSLSSASIETPINKFFIEFKKSLDQELKFSFNSIRAVERRSKLLWWKETLYSSSLKDSYRNLESTMQPIVMAFDLYEQLPKIAPVSVDFLLMDSLLILNESARKKMNFTLLLDNLVKEENKILLKKYFKEVENIEKRISLTDFISLLINDKVAISDFKKYTGIEKEDEISFSDLSVMVLHDLMTQFLIRK